MSLIVVVMLVVCIGLPMFHAVRVARLDEPDMAGWLIVVADAAVFVALVLIVGRWDMAGYYTRLAVAFGFAASVAWSLARHVSRPWAVAGRPAVRRHWTTLVSLAVFSGALAYVGYGLAPPAGARDLAFPLRGGRFMVGQGGGVSLLNRHAGHPAQRHAADIVAIGPWGFRAAGLAPKRLDRYVIHGMSVVSPCAGTVVEARDDLPDLIPPKADRDHPRGNHVIVDCGGFNVELAHLREASVRVANGDAVAAGDIVGAVGNSGNTTEPHLHVHAVDPDTGTGLPMAFGGRAPVRNRLFVN